MARFIRVRTTSYISHVLFAAMVSLVGMTAIGDTLRYLSRSDEALAQLLLDLRSAEKSIDMTYFMFEPCSAVGQAVVDIVSGKTKSIPNFRARILVDALYFESGQRAAFASSMRQRRIQVRFYNAFESPNPLANQRNHTKLLVIDGAKYISGGRNITDEYYALRPDQAYVDREVAVTGGSALRAQRRFEALWSSQFVFEAPPAGVKEMRALKKSCDKNGREALDVALYMRNNGSAIAGRIPVTACVETRFVLDDPAFVDFPGGESDGRGGRPFLSGERFRRKETTAAIVSALEGAQSSILMENQYFVLSDRLVDIFERARSRGIALRLYTSLNPDDELVGVLHQKSIAAVRKEGGSTKVIPISNLGALTERWALSPNIAKTYLHAKAFVIDRRLSIVSSYNLDPRSFHTNLESAVVVENCPAFAKIVAEPLGRLQQIYKTDLTCLKCQAIDPPNERTWKAPWLQDLL